MSTTSKNTTATLGATPESQIRTSLAALGYYCATLWHTDDVKNVRSDLGDDQCRQVLEHCEGHHDATIGMNWDVIQIVADHLFPEGNQ